MKNKRQVKLVKRIKTIRQKYLILLGSAIVTILIVSTVNIVQWYQTEQYAQATRKDRERFEAVEADMQVLIQQLPKIEKPGTDWQIRKDCSQASMKFESNPPKSCGVGIESTTPVNDIEITRRHIDQYDKIFKQYSSFRFTPNPTTPIYPNLEKGLEFDTDDLGVEFDLDHTTGYGGGNFTHTKTGIDCWLIYEIIHKEPRLNEALLRTSFGCRSTSNALHF